MEFLRARREKDNGLAVKDPELPESIEDIWGSAAQLATVGIFVLLFGAFLYVCRPVLMPVLAAMVIGTTFAPIVKAAARRRISPWVTAVLLGILLVAAAGTAVTLLAQPVSEWIGKAPEIGASIKQKLYVLDRPLSALRELQEVLMPAGGPAVAVEPSHWGMVTPVIAAFVKSLRQAGSPAAIFAGPTAEDPIVRTQLADHPEPPQAHGGLQAQPALARFCSALGLGHDHCMRFLEQDRSSSKTFASIMERESCSQVYQ